MHIKKPSSIHMIIMLFCAAFFVMCVRTSTPDLLNGSFIVNQAPLIISPRNISVQINSSTKFSASGGTSPYTYSISNGSGTLDKTAGLYIAPSSVGNVVIEALDSKGNRDFSIVTILKDPVTIYSENFQSGSYDTSKWIISGAPSVISNTLRMNQNDHMRYGTVLGAGEAVTIDLDLDNINGANGATFCTPNILVKSLAPAAFGFSGAATEAIYALIDETGTFRIPSSQGTNFNAFWEIRNGRVKIRIEWNANQLRISKSDFEQVGSPLNLTRSAYFNASVWNFLGAGPIYANGFRLELFNNVACENGGRIYSISIFKP